MTNNSLGIFLNSNLKLSNSKEALTKRRGNSQIPFQKIPDIITQVKPFSISNFSQPLNIHKSALTPSNKSRDFLQPNLLLPSKSSEDIHKKTIILDLDETLVHSSTTSFKNNDIILNVDFDSILYNIYVLVRPGVENFIKKLSKIFEIVIFTASISRYASPLLDILDKEKKIKYRLYREHCTFLNGIYIKELKRLNRDLKDVIIVDNSPIAYAFDTENGLPIKSWYGDKNDNEFDIIFPLLEFLSEADDVRDYIGLFVENNEIKYEISNKIINAVNNIENNIDDKDNETNTNDNNKNDNIIDSKNNNDKNSNNIFCLSDFLNFNKNKIIGNALKKRKLKNTKNNFKKEDFKIPNINHQSNNIINIQNYDNKKNNDKINNNNNLNELKQRKRSFRNKKNTFRLNQKPGDSSPKQLSNNINNKKINFLLPLSLSLTNSTKMKNYKERENMNNLKFLSIKEISKNNNSNSTKDLDNEHKVTSLLDRFDKNKNTYNNSLMNNINIKNNNKILTRNEESFILNKNSLIHSQFFYKHPYLSINNNKNKLINGSYYSLKSKRSKSSSNFINSNNKKMHPKTPNGNQRFYNLDLLDEKNSLKFGFSNGLDGIKLNQTTMRIFTPSTKPINQKIKIKKLGLKKEK